MQINYKETTSDLKKRIDIHNQFGGKNIDEWMLNLLQLSKGSVILDAACGAGKQCLSYYDYLNGHADITGGDVSDELLTQAKQESAKKDAKINYIPLDFNQPFPAADNLYDLVSCCFAIYYAKDIPFTIKEIHRVLKPGGRFFTTGPLPQNKKLFYDIIRDATQKPIPPMPGSSRFGSEIYSEIKSRFPEVEMFTFENPLTFNSVEPFIEYTRASLSEDRKLWNSFFDSKETFEIMMQKIEESAKRRLQADGKLVMTKVVGGILAVK